MMVWAAGGAGVVRARALLAKPAESDYQRQLSRFAFAPDIPFIEWKKERSNDTTEREWSGTNVRQKGYRNQRSKR
jgi:hypothetical protein